MALSMVRGTAPDIPIILEDADGLGVSLQDAERVEVYLRQREDDIFICYTKEHGEESENIQLSDGTDYTLVLSIDPDDLYALRHGRAEIQVGWIDENGKPMACIASDIDVDKLIKGGKIK